MGNHANDLAVLRDEFGDEWEFSVRWITAASGPDVKVYEARLNNVVVSAGTTVELAQKIRGHEQP
jgi:hypothetical protein